MANKLAQKKFRFEFEFSIDMEEMREEHLCNCETAEQLEALKRLQKALLENRPALLQQMIARAFGRLQEYVDYLASQDNLVSLESVARTLEVDDQDTFLENPTDFADITHPLRSAALSMRVESSSIQEQVQGEDGVQGWQPVWADLLNETELGKQLKGFSVPHSTVSMDGSSITGHYLLARHLTRRCDGVHFEARCTCGKLFTATAADEEEALQAAWAAFKRHHEIALIGQKIRRGWIEMRKRRYGES